MACSPLPDHLIFFANTISCIISLISSLLVIIVIIKKKLYITQGFKILLYMSFNDSLRTVVVLIETLSSKTSLTCIFIVFFKNFFFFSNILWALSFSVTIYQIIVLEITNFERFHKFWLLISYGLAAIVEGLPLSTESFGYDEGVCQIKVNTKGQIWRFLVFLLPASCILIAIIVIFFKVYRRVKILEICSVKSLIFDRGFVYAAIICLVFIPLLILRIFQLFNASCITWNLVAIMFVVNVWQGLMNGIAFYYNKNVRECLSNKSLDKPEFTGHINSFESFTSLRISFKTG